MRGREWRYAAALAALVGLWLGLRARVKVGVLAVVLVVAGVGVFLAARGSDRSHAATLESLYNVVYVDKDSIGGTCDDTAGTWTVADRYDREDRPYCSMDEAEDRVPNGGAIVVRAGDYGSWTVDDVQTSMTRIRPMAGERVTVDNINFSNGTFWDLSGVEVTGYAGTNPTQCQGRICINGGADIRIVGNHIHDTVAGVYVATSADRVTIASNRIENVSCVSYFAPGTCSGTTLKAGYGIVNSGTSTDWQIVNNVIDDTDGDCIQLGTTRRMRIDGNVMSGCRADAGNDDHGDSIQTAGSASDVQITRNVFRDSTKGLESTSAVSTTRQYRNWLVADNVFLRLNQPISNIVRSVGYVLRNNLFWDNQWVAIKDVQDSSAAATSLSDVHMYNNVFGHCVGNRVDPDGAGAEVTECQDAGGSIGPFNDATTSLAYFDHNLVGVDDGDGYGPNSIVGLTDCTGASSSPCDNSAIAALFTDEANDDFVPALGSDLVDAGVAGIRMGPIDLAREPRVTGAAPDLGPYERP